VSSKAIFLNRAAEFRLEQSSAYRDYAPKRPEALKDLSLSYAQRRSVLIIGDRVESETDTDIPLEQAGRFFEILRTFGWLVY
jgi:hypothetical protein